ncbi:hypothetical protein ACFOET_12720 [Parapedobacter deserti]|uniref:DUF4142 domain-containing protein n=1 Tax=Parapedobacter deserti TaxID=1912957 RepID=A0ABV7JK66_9SPHI
MKSLVLSAIICATAVGSNAASSHHAAIEPARETNKELVNDPTSVDAFKQVIAFHQRNVDVLWEQYGLAEARIRKSRGNHAELDRDKAFFIGVYQQDIVNGVRIAESKKAIEEIEASFAEKHAQRDAYEAKQFAKLQAHLRVALNEEKKRFDKAIKKHTKLVNSETLPLIREAEEHFAVAIARANNFTGTDVTIAATK